MFLINKVVIYFIVLIGDTRLFCQKSQKQNVVLFAMCILMIVYVHWPKQLDLICFSKMLFHKSLLYIFLSSFWHSAIHLSTLTNGFSGGGGGTCKYLGLYWGVLVGTVEF